MVPGSIPYPTDTLLFRYPTPSYTLPFRCPTHWIPYPPDTLPPWKPYPPPEGTWVQGYPNLPERTWDQRYPPLLMDRMTDACEKHYLPTTSLAEGNYTYLKDWLRQFKNYIVAVGFYYSSLVLFEHREQFTCTT